VCMGTVNGHEPTRRRDRRPDPGAVRLAISRLHRLDPVAADAAETLAFLLCRVADADRTVSSEETACIEAILTAVQHLDEDEAVLLAEISKHRERLADCATAYRVSRTVRQRASRDELAALLDALVRVAAADGRITPEEVRIVRQIAAELGFARDEADSHLHPQTGN
jgi:uncharacterized tellurite resistance protein B-like protein